MSQASSLEWRYLFSQAEIILSDHLPPPARTAFLAFKATVKMHINYGPEIWENFGVINEAFQLREITFVQS